MNEDYMARKLAEQFCMRRDGRRCSPWQPLYSVHLQPTSWEEKKLYGVEHGITLLQHDFGKWVNQMVTKALNGAEKPQNRL